MTAKELIELLQSYPDEQEIFTVDFKPLMLLEVDGDVFLSEMTEDICLEEV